MTVARSGTRPITLVIDASYALHHFYVLNTHI